MKKVAFAVFTAVDMNKENEEKRETGKMVLKWERNMEPSLVEGWQITNVKVCGKYVIENRADPGITNMGNGKTNTEQYDTLSITFGSSW